MTKKVLLQQIADTLYFPPFPATLAIEDSQRRLRVLSKREVLPLLEAAMEGDGRNAVFLLKSNLLSTTGVRMAVDIGIFPSVRISIDLVSGSAKEASEVASAALAMAELGKELESLLSSLVKLELEVL
jgi:hypothetical protein